MSQGASEGSVQPGDPVSAGDGRWSRPLGVAVVDTPDEHVEEQRGGVVYLARLPDGPITVLAGASAVLYRGLVDPSGEPSARIAHALGVPPEEIDAEAVVDFANELVVAGLLERRD